MLKSDKVTEVEEIKGNLSSSKIAILTEFQGMTVAEMTELRKLFREADINYKVYKNTLVAIAAREVGVSGVDEFLVGTTALAFSQNADVVAPAKIVKDFSAKHQKFRVKGGILDNKAINSDGVERLSSLPPKEVLVSMVLGGMQAPLSRLVSVLQGSMRNLVFVLKSLAEQKEKGVDTSGNASEVPSDNPPIDTSEVPKENVPDQQAEGAQDNKEAN